MKKFIYIFILLAGFQFVKGQQIVDMHVQLGEAIYRLDSLPIIYTPSTGATSVTLPVRLVCKNTGNTLNIGDSIAMQVIFNEISGNPMMFSITKVIGTDSLIQTPFMNISLSITSIQEGNYANELCGFVPFVVYGGAGNERTPITEDPFCAVFTVTKKDVSIIEVNNLKDVSIYPNPVSNQLKINNLTEVTDVHIYSITGQLVKTISAATGSVDIDVNNLSSGIYIVKLQSGKNTRTEKIQVVR